MGFFCDVTIIFFFGKHPFECLAPPTIEYTYRVKCLWWCNVRAVWTEPFQVENFSFFFYFSVSARQYELMCSVDCLRMLKNRIIIALLNFGIFVDEKYEKRRFLLEIIFLFFSIFWFNFYFVLFFCLLFSSFTSSLDFVCRQTFQSNSNISMVKLSFQRILNFFSFFFPSFIQLFIVWEFHLFLNRFVMIQRKKTKILTRPFYTKHLFIHFFFELLILMTRRE